MPGDTVDAVAPAGGFVVEDFEDAGLGADDGFCAGAYGDYGEELVFLVVGVCEGGCFGRADVYYGERAVAAGREWLKREFMVVCGSRAE